MNFQRVPKLGSYMAIPLVYKSCLFDDSLAEAVANWQDVQKRKEEQHQEREAFENSQQQAKEQAEAQGAEFEPEEREWPVIQIDEFKTQD